MHSICASVLSSRGALCWGLVECGCCGASHSQADVKQGCST